MALSPLTIKAFDEAPDQARSLDSRENELARWKKRLVEMRAELAEREKKLTQRRQELMEKKRERERERAFRKELEVRSARER